MVTKAHTRLYWDGTRLSDCLWAQGTTVTRLKVNTYWYDWFHFHILRVPVAWAKLQCLYNEAPSDVNKSLDGCTYTGWKMTRIADQNIFLISAKGNRLSSGTSSATYRWWSLICKIFVFALFGLFVLQDIALLVDVKYWYPLLDYFKILQLKFSLLDEWRGKVHRCEAAKRN